jgi:hypothetical protein
VPAWILGDHPRHPTVEHDLGASLRESPPAERKAPSPMPPEMPVVQEFLINGWLQLVPLEAATVVHLVIAHQERAVPEPAERLLEELGGPSAELLWFLVDPENTPEERREIGQRHRARRAMTEGAPAARGLVCPETVGQLLDVLVALGVLRGSGAASGVGGR